jgi:predicted TIM-barrel fold metal-dependent hydrolase
MALGGIIMRRRDFLAGGLAAAVGAGGPVADAAAQSGPFTPVRQNRFIDAHCHLFNVLDVPAESFIKKVVLPNVVQSMSAGSRDYAQLFQDPRFRGSFEVMLHMLAVAVSRKACEPDDEMWVIDEMEQRGARARNAQKVESDLLKDILDEVWWPKRVQTQLTRVGDVFISYAALNQIKYLLRKEAFPGLSEQELRGMSADEASDCREAARVIYAERDGVFSRTIRWGLLFTRYRFQLAEELQRLHGGRAKLLTPALVDFGAWFGPLDAQSGDRTVPMRRQTEVMARIARRRNGPRVHGFVGFDPLRQALFRQHGGPPEDEPLTVAKKAVEDHGFIGVKLYPPMGFRPTGNAALGAAFPPHVRAANGLGADAGRKLDAALDDLYRWCAENDVPVMAHTANSYGSLKDYGLRADPAAWVKVLEKYPKLRLNMAHFGGFNRGGNREHPQQSWGWTIGRMLISAATPNVYADISFFSEIMHRSGEQRRYATWLFKRFLEAFPQAPQRLVYGTDWTMVGYADGFPSRAIASQMNEELYPDVVSDFLRRDLGFTASQIDGVMFGNAVRFMGLGQDQKAQGTRGRLEQFYLRAGVNAAWMQEFDRQA